MQRSASDIISALLVSGEHSFLFDRFEPFDSMDLPHEEGKAIQLSDSSHSDDRVNSMSAAATSTPFDSHVPLHLKTTSPLDNLEPLKHPNQPKKPPKKRKWRKPKDMPKRPLSAYNIFFQNERKQLACGKAADDAERSSCTSMGFAGLAQNVASKWRSLDSSARAYYEAEAGKDQVRYRQEVDEWKRRKEDRKAEELRERKPTSSISTSRIGETTHANSLLQHKSANSSNAPDTIAPALSLWPSMQQTIESLGNLYDANVDLLDAAQSDSLPLQQVETTRMDSIEPVPINPAKQPGGQTSSLGVASSLHQLFTEMEEEELDFLMSLRNLK
jgi:hypothetical protein